MLARWLRFYYLFQLVLGAALGYVWLAGVVPLALALLLGAVVWLFLIQAWVIAVSHGMSMSGGAGARTRVSGRWRLFWGELRAALTVFMLRQAWASAAPGVQHAVGEAAYPAVPVVLVHGYICNHRVWDDVIKALRQAGHSVLAVDLEPLFGSIDDYSPLIAQAVSDLQAATGAPQVALIGHSMGGLAIRAWMRSEGTARVAQVITLGTPHQGTRLVKLPLTTNTAQMVWQSEWLRQLQASETPATRALMHLVLSTHDNIVYPQREQILAGAQVTEFKGLGHLELCLNPDVIAWLVAQLSPQAVESAPETDALRLDVAHAPASPRALFWAFTWLALQGFGGVVAIVQRELVERKRWLTREQFVEDWAVAQVLPGPNVVNLSLMIGDRYFGWRGGLAALAGLLIFPLLIVLLLAVLLSGVSDIPAVQGALRGMGAVAAGMIIATGLKLVASLSQNVLGKTTCFTLAAVTFAAVALLRWPLIWVLLVLGGVAGWRAYTLLAPVPSEDAP